MFRSNVNFPQTRIFPAAYTGSDHDLVMVTFRLKRIKRELKKRHIKELNLT